MKHLKSSVKFKLNFIRQTRWRFKATHKKRTAVQKCNGWARELVQRFNLNGEYSPPKKARNARENINEKHILLLTNSLGSPNPRVGGGKLKTLCISSRRKNVTRKKRHTSLDTHGLVFTDQRESHKILKQICISYVYLIVEVLAGN